jgi:UDP-N-acetylmuramoylalanine--D-glutamate ligase
MIDGLPFLDATVAVLGLARSGRAAAHALAASGAKILAWDDNAAARQTAIADGIDVTNLGEADPADWAALILSPGIPFTHAPHPIVSKALGAGVPVIGDIELLWRAKTGARFIGITGTNGKSTTTSLIHHILKSTGRSVAVGGNLGIPVLSLPRLGSDGFYVIEMSSYQLDLIDQTRFTIAVLLNITPDHLDRHGDMEGYIAAKRRIFRRQADGDMAVIGVDDAPCRAIAETGGPIGLELVQISSEQPVAGGVYVIDGILIDDTEDKVTAITDLSGVTTLPGRHNWQNAAAAFAACRAVGVEADQIAAALATYPGLPHRQERVGHIGNVAFINDSKATNADAASKALGCYDRIYWIAGGVPKAGGISTLHDYFGRIAHAFLIGQAVTEFAATLEGNVEYSISVTLAAATRAAAAAAAADPLNSVVLFSPACASFDQFANFEARGDAFRTLVGGLMAEAA